MPTAIAALQLIALLAPLVERALQRGSDITNEELAQAARDSDLALEAWTSALIRRG
jgi:hypothetical protein